ncbi:hypothetical protein [Sphingosinicella terrae]|uniref:hypothetical protein n=1 Tax=Sphingosinicella terrae TaxID=2172047 RepID=UPI000E0DBCDF|nr:hypothetical protein [Sphingosinicella terrae]
MIGLQPSTRRAARRLRLATLGATLLLVLVTAAAATLLFTDRVGAAGGAIEIDRFGLPPVPAALVQLASGALLAVALLQLARMLGEVEAGRPFATARPLRGFARFLFLSVLASILLPPFIQLALAAAAGSGRAVFALAGADVLMLFVTGLLFLVARLLDEAQRIADDASQIV